MKRSPLELSSCLTSLQMAQLSTSVLAAVKQWEKENLHNDAARELHDMIVFLNHMSGGEEPISVPDIVEAVYDMRPELRHTFTGIEMGKIAGELIMTEYGSLSEILTDLCSELNVRCFQGQLPYCHVRVIHHIIYEQVEIYDNRAQIKLQYDASPEYMIERLLRLMEEL